MGFCSVSDVATFLCATIAPDNAQVLQAIEEATAVIKNYCNQEIEQVELDTVLLDGSGTAKLFLPELPVNQIDSVFVDGTALDANGYALAENGILMRKFGVWTEGARNIEIVYTHGYATIPDDLKGVCYRSAARIFQAQLKAAKVDHVGDVKSISVGDYSISFGSEGGSDGESQGGISAARTLLVSEKEILNRYRSKRI